IGAMLAEDEVHAAVVCAVHRVIGAMLAEDEVHAAVVRAVHRVIGAVLRQLVRADVGAAVIAARIFAADRVVGAVLGESRERRRRNGGSCFGTGCRGCTRRDESERGEDGGGKKGGSGVHEWLLEFWVGLGLVPARHSLRTKPKPT